MNNMTCPICGAEMLVQDCEFCDDGEVCDEDPVNGDEYETCQDCKGEGVYRECSRLPHSDEQMEAWRSKEKKHVAR